MNTNRIIVYRYVSPCGSMLLGSFGDALCLCDWENNRHRKCVDNSLRIALNTDFSIGNSSVIERAGCQLDEYFAGQRAVFDVPVKLVGTEFRKMVWTALLDIGYGTTVTYADVANMIGKPTAVRAVANAIGANPISILVPCHRVVGSSGALTGYAGGLAAKKYLLELERRTRNNPILP